MEIKSRKRYSDGFKRKGMEEFRDETMPGGGSVRHLGQKHPKSGNGEGRRGSKIFEKTTVTWTATDVAGNTASAVQTVMVFPSATGDCDGDGLTDWEEEMEWGTDATLWDTDGDGMGDGEEAAAGLDPVHPAVAAEVRIGWPAEGRRLP